MKHRSDIDIDHIAPYIRDRRFRKGRLRIIKDKVDFAGKHVLDLGCADGSITFLIAGEAESITAVDANAKRIEQNKENARILGFENIEFVCEQITPKFLKELPNYDVVLFASVFHHMLANSNSYEWNNQEQSEIFEILDIVGSLGTVYVFEMGESHGYGHIGDPLKAVVGEEPHEWVLSHVYGPKFKDVEVIKGAAYQRIPYRYFPQLRRLTAYESSPFSSTFTHKASSVINKWLGINYKDFRYIYIGFK
jgi:SAM-dependent methyltransferase